MICGGVVASVRERMNAHPLYHSDERGPWHGGIRDANRRA